MKLLFDQNLSRKLVDQLQHEFPDSIHVTAVGLDAATDRELWQFAREHGFAIVSKDSDFRQLAFLYGPPKGDLATRRQRLDRRRAAGDPRSPRRRPRLR